MSASSYGFPIPSSLLPSDASPEWNNKADNAWQLTAATLVGLQSVPGLVILYGSMVKRKWAVNSAFMALYAFACVLICWVSWAHGMAFGSELLPFVGKPNHALSGKFLLAKSSAGYFPMADFVFYQFAFAAITVVLLAGSLLGRMNFYAWMLFVPLWLTFSYTVGAFSIWGKNGFLQGKIIDYAGGFVIHLSSGIAGFTAAYWVGPRISYDRQNFPPNNIIHVLGGAGFLWMGWTGFNGGATFQVGEIASLAIFNTHLCTATSLLVWLTLDMMVYTKSSVIGAVQGMITGLVCITPGAGLVDSWAAVLMGALSGSIPWYTMMVLHKKSAFFQSVDDTLGVFHTHAVAGVLGGLLSGVFAKPGLLRILYSDDQYGPGLIYSFSKGESVGEGMRQIWYQLVGAGFIIVWNVVVTSLVCVLISHIVDLRMQEEELEVGDDAAHGEEAYALWGDGERMRVPLRLHISPTIPSLCRRRFSIPLTRNEEE
ncbi:ammonium transporter 3 member 3-like [Vigna unguiculata]|uniref:Ammonium transporter n=1 Tax=Vigna unguiculata TaxID=3917 RepID=A0A4D6KWE0_VIGUN|nr:ammonium transporter 3 member 3-like [Vigna unguiculata]XP_027930066.1 ammonium transporter 3 member 3-like [Vigna unguiculata]QCD82118.1 ammonium transporter [Vigna unguiculata]